MRLRIFTVLVLALVACPARAADPSTQDPAAPDGPVVGRVLIADDAACVSLGARGEVGSHYSAVAQLFARHGLSRGRTLCRVHDSSTRFLQLTSTRPGFDAAAAAAALRATGLVRAAVPDVRLRLHAVPNDPDRPLQWWVDDGGFADVRLVPAWDVEQGSTHVRIGIMDTGVDLGHPDLASKIWNNPGEIPANGMDDDDNGYVDDVHGWDFGDGDADPDPNPVPDPSVFDLDVGFHGTFVAAIAAAATNNGEGIAGAARNCPIVPMKVANSAGELTLGAITEAFGYAATNHIEVVNISLGTPDSDGVAEYFQALVDAATAAGVLVVASAGNDGTSDPNFPAACTGVLSVAATDADNARAEFSNFGPLVRIAAPGAAMWSAMCRNYEIDEFSQLFYEVFMGWDGIRPYMGGDGTSFSAPLVAGACALVRSRHPEWAPLVVSSHMVATGDGVAYDQPIGPKLNVQRAVTDPTLATPDGAFAHVSLNVVPNPSNEGTFIRFSLPAAGPARLRVFDCMGRLMRELPIGEMSAGPHATAWDGTDASGDPVDPGVYVVRLETTNGAVVRRLARVR
ncbi:MAG TPA: S8 family serine peptidase [Methylomirabilota bacterium]|jgi:subtilisin family serine protease|nr:S8 family serine peptidase [Methylomirabilota bacterium]